MTEYRTHPRQPTRKEVEAALSTLDFPLDRADPVPCVTEQTGDDVTATNPGARTDRAGGPYGEGSGGGEPGAVIDLRSPAFSDGALLPARCSKDGGNVSPALEWSTPPDGTAELVLLCEDPDAPGGTFVHWLVSGIDPGTTTIAEGQEPPGSVSWQNGYGETGYGGPQPPIGDDAHRYMFRLIAL